MITLPAWAAVEVIACRGISGRGCSVFKSEYLYTLYCTTIDGSTAMIQRRCVVPETTPLARHLTMVCRLRDLIIMDSKLRDAYPDVRNQIPKARASSP